MVHEPEVYLCLEDQVSPFQKECDKTEKGSVKVKKLSKLDMEQISCMELSRLSLFSLQRRQLREHIIEERRGWIGIYSFFPHPTP